VVDAVYFPLLVPLLVVPALGLASRWWRPRATAWVVTAVSVVLAVGSTASLVLLTIAGASQVPLVAHVGRWSASSVRDTRAVELPVDILAAALLVALVTCAAVASCRSGTAIAVAYQQARRQTDSELVVLPEADPIAYALPGRPGRIVVSTGMLGSLDASERRALLAHERAHLTGAHYLFVTAVELAAALNPLLRPLRGTVRFAVERWADEVAAEGVGNRALAARAVGKAALATRRAQLRGTVLMAATAGPVPRRVAALLAPPRLDGRRTLLAWTTGLVVLVAVVVVAGTAWAAARDLHTILELAEVNS
jgi:beta-lactamase regulating signal transducer with metallopeptidase domain